MADVIALVDTGTMVQEELFVESEAPAPSYAIPDGDHCAPTRDCVEMYSARSNLTAWNDTVPMHVVSRPFATARY